MPSGLTTPGCRRAIAGVLLLSLATVWGCSQPELPASEYGQILKALPRVKGSDKLFPLPKLETPEEKPESAQ